MMYGLMFVVSKDGEVSPTKFGMTCFTPDRSVILLEEFSPAVWLWHGEAQSLIDRRIANRQAEALKGYGYRAADTVIGSKARTIYEIDQRKVGKDSETTRLNEEFQNILSMKTTPLDDNIVIFQSGEAKIRPLDKKIKERLDVTPPVQEPKAISEVISEKAQELGKDTILPIESESKSIKSKVSKKKEKISEPLEILDKPEFEFESYVKELPPSKQESAKKEIMLFLKAIESSPIIKSLMERVEQIEGKLDSIIESLNKIQ
ncbi:MAG: hypothetical protein ACTSPS_02745 [Promethearchaeota archaeon]